MVCAHPASPRSEAPCKGLGFPLSYEKRAAAYQPGAPPIGPDSAKSYHGRHFRFLDSIPTTGEAMAIYRSLYYGDVVVGVGGRITIPQDMRDELGIVEGDMLRVRVEASNGSRQLVVWRSEDQPEDD